MSTTTQILFNSPALHSLNRTQLTKLCKIHGIKAGGKNVELVRKLKEHAVTLPRGEPLSIAARSEGEVEVKDDNGEEDKENHGQMMQWKPRVSEQWEVMESITELEESSSQGTLTSLTSKGSNPSEFGTGKSKSNGSVSSSLRVLASSLGLNRSKSTLNGSTNSVSTTTTLPGSFAGSILTQFPSAPNGLPTTEPDLLAKYSQIAEHMPQSTLPPTADEPIPGQHQLSGIPAPPNARLSFGIGSGDTRLSIGPGGADTTTIRLVASDIEHGKTNQTPKLKAFTTSFDLVQETPAPEAKRLWPVSPGIHPVLSGGEMDHEDVEMDTGIPGRSTPGLAQTSLAPPSPFRSASPAPSPASASQRTTLAPPSLEPFVFGSPLPQHNVSNTQFRDAAKSVLEEMNARLEHAGLPTVSGDLLERVRDQQTISSDDGYKGEGVDRVVFRDRFEKVHEDAFKKMDSIVVKRGNSPEKEGRKKRKSSVLENRPRLKPRGSALGYGRMPSGNPGLAGRRRSSARGVSGTRVISNGRRKMGVSGFGHEIGGNREGVGEEAERAEKKLRTDGQIEIDREVTKRVSIALHIDDAGDEKRKKEKEMIRRKLDLNKARRRSSMGRVSVGGGKAPLIPNQKPKSTTSRFGFLSSAKSMVQNVWKLKTASASNFSVKPVPSRPEPKKLTTMGPPVVKKVLTPAAETRAGRIPSTSTSRSLRPPTVNGTLTSSRSASSSRSRSPIPAFNAQSTSTRSRVNSSTNLTVSSQAGSSVGKRIPSTNGSMGSLGTRGSSHISSMSTRGSLASVADASMASVGVKKFNNNNLAPEPRKRTISRLMAPTASSLAKAGSSLRPSPQEQAPGLMSVGEEASTAKPNEEEASTNSPDIAERRQVQSPRPVNVFIGATVGSSNSTLFHQASFAGAGENLAQSDNTLHEDVNYPVHPKLKTSTSRKPRISRSKVIAKLASQRAASGSSAKSAFASSSRARSSLGTAKASKTGRASAGGDALMNAKKRARQSEFARRRSRALTRGSVGTASRQRDDEMDVEHDI